MSYYGENKGTPLTVPFAKTERMREVLFNGTPLPGCRRFTIYFQHDTYHEPANIELAFDVRFNYGEDHNVIVCNEKFEGNWGKEYREIPFQFTAQATFFIRIEVYDNCYRIFLDGRQIGLFERRRNGAKPVNTIRIAHDVGIGSLQII